MKNSQYWMDKENRAKKARAHAEKMKRDYPDLIRDCVKRSMIYGPGELETKPGIAPDIISAVPKDNSFKHKPGLDSKIEISVASKDSVSAAFAEKGDNNRVCVLNFASYKEPGGMFLKGSKAQEEYLCHESFLFNVLYSFQEEYYEWNKKHLNQGLYLNRAIYSPDVMFEHNGKRAAIDVLTCAAPNYSAAFKYQGISKERNSEILRSRIAYVLSILEEQKPDVAILGAWGCGVFGQDPLEVASLFREMIQIHTSMRIIFAVPDGRDGNYEAFRMVFHHPVFKNE